MSALQMSSEDDRRYMIRHLCLIQEQIEKCMMIQELTPEKIPVCIARNAQIPLPIVEQVLKTIEDNNEEFFKAYRIRVILREQIERYNALLKQQDDVSLVYRNQLYEISINYLEDYLEDNVSLQSSGTESNDPVLMTMPEDVKGRSLLQTGNVHSSHHIDLPQTHNEYGDTHRGGFNASSNGDAYGGVDNLPLPSENGKLHCCINGSPRVDNHQQGSSSVKKQGQNITSYSHGWQNGLIRAHDASVQGQSMNSNGPAVNYQAAYENGSTPTQGM